MLRAINGSDEMKKINILGLCIAGACALPMVAEARDGCGEGWFFNGVGCAPMERRYAPPPSYGYGEPRPYVAPQFAPGPRYYDEGPRGGGGDMYRGRDGQLHCRNPKFTVQDGQCKPYSGR